MRGHPIVIKESDARKLRGLLGARGSAPGRDLEHLQDLKSELERALVVESEQVPAEVITMDSRVRVVDLETGARSEYVLVFPAEADLSAKRISVLAPLGTALLGCREGDEVEWETPGGPRRLRIEQVEPPVPPPDSGDSDSGSPRSAHSASAGAH